jgi:VWFA-related protein
MHAQDARATTRMMKFSAIAVFVLAVALQGLAQTSSAPTASQILTQVSSVYGSCHSYADEGEVSLRTMAGLSPAWVEHFSTAFVRPDDFRFELRAGATAHEQRFIIWKSGAMEKSYRASIFQRSPLDDALLSIFGLSRGSSLTVPALLMPDLFHGPGLFASFTSVKLNGEEKIDGRRAFKIEAQLQDQSMTLWIDENQFVILKVEQKSKAADFKEGTIVRYRPTLNPEVSDRQLAFNAPGGDTIDYEPAGAVPELKTNVPPRLKTFGKSAYLTPEQMERFSRKRDRQAEDEDVVKVNTDLVVSDVLVVNQQGYPVRGLRQEDFIVKEDSQPQEISSFSIGSSDAVPRSIVLIIDYSNSQLPYVITSVEAAKTLVDKLNPRDRMALVTDDVKLLVDFTSDKQLLKAELDGLKKRAMSGWLGRSKQYDALMATLNELFSGDEERAIIIFQTDGDQLEALGAAAPPELRPYVPAKKFSFEDLLTAAERARVTIYSIIPGVRFAGLSGLELLDHARRDWENRLKANAQLHPGAKLPEPTMTPPDEVLQRNAEHWTRLHLGVVGVAKITGGWAQYLEQPEQAEQLYAQILNDINQRYVMAYYPTNRKRDGMRRKVSIEIRGHPEYVIVGRKSYFAPPS